MSTEQEDELIEAIDLHRKSKSEQMPKGWKWIRNRLVLALHSMGYTQKEIGWLFRLNQSQVSRIISKVKDA